MSIIDKLLAGEKILATKEREEESLKKLDNLEPGTVLRMTWDYGAGPRHHEAAVKVDDSEWPWSTTRRREISVEELIDYLSDSHCHEVLIMMPMDKVK